MLRYFEITISYFCKAIKHAVVQTFSLISTRQTSVTKQFVF